MQLSTSGPKWGRNIQQKKSWTLIIMVGVQLLMNKSQLDNDDDDQDPPPPKKQKVVHESADNRNLGTWGMAIILDGVRRQLTMVASIGQKLYWIQIITQPKREIRKEHLQLWMRCEVSGMCDSRQIKNWLIMNYSKMNRLVINNIISYAISVSR